MNNDEKILKTVENFIYGRLEECVNDCIDGAKLANNMFHRFNGLVNDSISIIDFIQNNHLEYYTKLVMKYYEEDTYNGKGSILDWQNSLPKKLPIKILNIVK